MVYQHPGVTLVAPALQLQSHEAAVRLQSHQVGVGPTKELRNRSEAMKQDNLPDPPADILLQTQA